MQNNDNIKGWKRHLTVFEKYKKISTTLTKFECGQSTPFTR